MKHYLPIDFKGIAAETEVRKGNIFYSATFNAWVVSGHPVIDLICIDPPFDIGGEFDGRIIEKVTIVDNQWCFETN